MATFKVMVRWPGGQQRQELQSGCTVGEFQDIASTVTGITAQEQNIAFGLPPRPLPLDSMEAIPLSLALSASLRLTGLCLTGSVSAVCIAGHTAGCWLWLVLGVMMIVV